MTDTQESTPDRNNSSEYTMQYEVVGRDSDGNLFWPCHHAAGLAGFATVECAKVAIEKLEEFDRSFYAAQSQRPTYVVRAEFVAEERMYQEVSDLFGGVCPECEAEEDAITALPKIKQFD